MSKYNRGYPYGDDYCGWKLGLAILAGIGLLYVLPEPFTTIVLWIYVISVIFLVVRGD